MTFDPEVLRAHPIPVAEQRLTARDCILYALSLGIGHDPLDPSDLRFVYETDLLAHPMMANVLGYPGFWLKHPGTGVTWRQLLHGEQRVTLHRPLPTQGELIGRTEVTAVIDKGPSKGAFIHSERRVTLAGSGEPLCSIQQNAVCRADGGQGGFGSAPAYGGPLPDRAPDATCDLPTLPQAALLYRLNGDENPLHADPAVAAEAGFERPILHGLCTFGVVGHALLRTVCGGDPARFGAMAARFSAPVYPGETLRSEIWREAGHITFRARAVERDLVVLTNGRLDLAG